jgi:neutral ceramidase
MHAHAYVDFSNVEVDPDFADGQPGRRTAPAEIGMSMFFGTEEGPGLPRRLLFLQRVASALRPIWRRVRRADTTARDETQAEKIPWVESGRRRILGIARLRRLPIPWRLHPALRLVRELDRAEDEEPKPWTPNVLPVQLFVVGDLAIAAVPAEFTTMSATRVRKMLLAELRSLGVRHAVVAGYSNAYAGYVTTAEEYTVQDYEGASTHFGKWTHAAYMTELRKLARRLQASDEPGVGEDIRPPRFAPAELAARSFATR